MKTVAVLALMSSLMVSSSFAGIGSKMEFPSRALTREAQDRDADPYILHVLAEHERAFPGAMRYGDIFYYTALNRLGRVQQSVLLDLHNRTDFAKLWQEKKDLSEITATVNADSAKGENLQILDNWAWDWKITQLKGNLRTYVDGYGDKATILASLTKGVNAKLKGMKKRSADSYKSQEDRLLLALYVIVSRMLEADPDLKFRELYDAIEEAGVGILDYLHDPAAYKAALEELEDTKYANKQLELTHKEIIEKIYKTGEPLQLKKGQMLTLKEVHPNIAIFRGYVGNDCSTSFSPGFVFTPTDRYFYLFDQAGKSLGYLGLSLVTIAEKPAVFIHTIQGPDISGELTEIAMRAMTLAAPQLYSTDLVVLGPDASISSNVNFHSISSTMIAAVNGKPVMKMSFADKELRRIIARFGSTMEYDNPERNHSGRKLEFLTPEIMDVSIHKNNFDAKFLRPLLKTPADPSRCEKWAH